MAPARKVRPPYCSRALSSPIREDAPAASTIPAKEGERDMGTSLQGIGYREQVTGDRQQGKKDALELRSAGRRRPANEHAKVHISKSQARRCYCTIDLTPYYSLSLLDFTVSCPL